MKNKILLFAIVLFFGCETERQDITDYAGILNLTVTKDNAYSDGVDTDKVIAIMPYNFATEADNTVDFYVYKNTVTKVPAAIRLAEINGIQSKIAEIEITHNEVQTLDIKAVITVNGVEISKTIPVKFKRAFPETITVETSTLSIAPQNYSTIKITTRLIRNPGIVTLKTVCNTTVMDAMGIQYELFNNYKNLTDDNGKIENSFSLGPSTTLGPLFITSTATKEDGTSATQTQIIYSR